MRLRRWIPGLVFLALAMAAAGGLHLTGNPRVPAGEGGPAAAGGQSAPAAGSAQRWRWVDTAPLLTARRLGALATTPEEAELAHQAEGLADHAVDLAFAEALRQAAEEKPVLTPAQKIRAEAKAKAQAAVAADEALIRRLSTEGSRSQAQLEVSQAQLTLDRDELDMAAESLERAGGDPQAQIKQLKAIHDAAQKDAHAPAAAAQAKAAARSDVGDSLLARASAWRGLRDKRAQLAEAERDVASRAERQVKRRAAIAQRIKDAEAAREAGQSSAAALAQGARANGEAAATVQELQRLSGDRRRVTMMGKRIQDHEALAQTYASWGALVDAYARKALHRVLEGLFSFALILLGTFLAVRFVDHLYEGGLRERPRTGTLRSVVKFGLEAVGAIAILFVVIGVPAQATTILGLAGAGLTVAMKDFIVAFFGWFVLMSKNGIRVGDWVEIKGVGGEVVEIGLFHTVLLETGSWSDAGHPTGRRVSFVNSFAIEGHYFNFSSSGRWMWDELTVLVPLGQDPYPVLEGVQQLVERETAANARLAEQEWRSGSGYKVKTFSAVPGFTMVPSSNGIEIHVRYVTRAPERHEARERLYREVVAIMHGKAGQKVDAG